MEIKKGVELLGIRPELMMGIIVADGVWRQLGKELCVTSICDSKHSRDSLHYLGLAADLRTRYFEDNGMEAARMLSDSLPDDFDVVVEGNHIHMEFQPKRG